MKPEPFDAPGRYLVPSRSKPGEKHLVDLIAYRRNGRCDCPAFTMNHEPRLRKGANPGDSTRCRHLLEARSAFIDLILREIADNEGRVS